jgi:hypothetical protein
MTDAADDLLKIAQTLRRASLQLKAEAEVLIERAKVLQASSGKRTLDSDRIVRKLSNTCLRPQKEEEVFGGGENCGPLLP